MELPNSTRTIRSASYVQVELADDDVEAREYGRALLKLNIIDALDLSVLDASPLRSHPKGTESKRPELGESAYEHIESIRQIKAGLSSKNPALFSTLAPLAATVPASVLIEIIRWAGVGGPLGVEAMIRSFKVAPVGRLHLERMEMVPAGMERGEMLFTIPLAPSETITVSHKEWSTSSSEYESIVQDYFESYSEKGVSEKTDASMATDNETKHSNAFNFQASASGGYGPVSMSVATGINSASEDRNAAHSSTQKAREVTEKASSRSRQEHKVSLKLEQKSGVEDSSFRTISNPNSDRALRIDFYRMMRRWRTDLYRYGLRLTFDIMVPNPGGRIWALHRTVHGLDEQLRKPFSFAVKPEDIADDNWSKLATTWNTVLAAPPRRSLKIPVHKTYREGPFYVETFEFTAPDGYTLATEVKGTGIWLSGPPDLALLFPEGSVVEAKPSTSPGLPHGGTFKVTTASTGGPQFRTVAVGFGGGKVQAETTLVSTANRTALAYEAWQFASWAVLRQAAIEKYEETLARTQARRDQLWAELVGKDTLSLRRLEREELIRQTLTWLFGPSFTAAPAYASTILTNLVKNEESAFGEGLLQILRPKLTTSQWNSLRSLGDMVQFVHQAVEWENLLYFLYPSFWGSDTLARQKLMFEHPDSGHRDFLRSGYARVVIPIRPGFEEKFAELLDKGTLSTSTKTPYVPIATEAAAYAKTNYMGIPPANPELHARPLLTPQQRKTWETMEGVVQQLDEVRKSTGEYPADLSALSGYPFKDAWDNDLVYSIPGASNDYDLISHGVSGTPGGEGDDADISAGASASLVATWFEYTPSSGIDIELNSALEKTA